MVTSRRPIVQISLDFTSLEEALEHARQAVRAGVDWLEAGTPLILSEGSRAVGALRREFPDHPIVADLKCMDGGAIEGTMMAKAGATHVVVMARAHPATVRRMVEAGREHGFKVMADDMACEDKPEAARAMEEVGVDYVVHHVGYDERNDPAVIAARGGCPPSPLDELQAIVRGVKIPVQAVGGLSLEEILNLPAYGVYHLVLSQPLPRDAQVLASAKNEEILRRIVAKIRARTPGEGDSKPDGKAR